MDYFFASVTTSLSLSVAQAGGGFGIAMPAASKEMPTDRIIVKLRDTKAAGAAILQPARVAELSASAGVALTHLRAMSGDAHVFRVQDARDSAAVGEVVRLLSQRPDVEYAEPDYPMRHQ
jgi:hypothetical protein